MQGAEVTRISLGDYPLPIMDEDLEKEKGVPENAMKLGRLIAAHDGLLIATPEYNGSLPPLLKNTHRLGEPDTQGWRPLVPTFPGKVGRPVFLLRRQVRRHTLHQSSARRAGALPDGGGNSRNARCRAPARPSTTMDISGMRDYANRWSAYAAH